MSHDVFISYSSKDKTIADAVCAKLEEKQIRVWIAPRDVLAGANFADSIINAINKCKIFVLIWSQDSNTSEHILNELNQAFEQGILIIPFRIQEVQPTNAMRYYIGRTHWLDALTPPLKNHISKLAETILINLEIRIQTKLPGEVQKPDAKGNGINDLEKHKEIISEIKDYSEKESTVHETEDLVGGGEKRTNLLKTIRKSRVSKGDHAANEIGLISRNIRTVHEFFIRIFNKIKSFAKIHKKTILILSLALIIVSAFLITGTYLRKNFPEFISSLFQPRPMVTEAATITPGLIISATPTQMPPTSTPTVTPKPFSIGSVLSSPIDGMTLVYVPAGEFAMGSRDGYGNDDEHPQHQVYLDEYWIDQTEVTNAMYEMCVADNGCTPPHNFISNKSEAYFKNAQFDDFPVIYVDWYQADAYCTWAGRELPTEAQWEMAARGPESFNYPWGNGSVSSNLANYDRIDNDIYTGDTIKVGSKPEGASPFGALDMAGNVEEWTADWWGEYSSEPETNPTGPSSGEERIVRGGSFTSHSYDLYSSNRWNVMESTINSNRIGFRCALSASKLLSLPTTSIQPTKTPNQFSIGSTQVSQIDGMTLNYVPEGYFIMGSPDSKGNLDEHPQHQIFLDAYWIDQTEVTNAMYAKCVDDGVCTLPHSLNSNKRNSYFGNTQFDNCPVIYVDWNQANEYCNWARRQLPTEAQWEKAARGPEGYTYPWGDSSPTSDQANFTNSIGDTTIVGSFPQGNSPYGAMDMAGNVREWTADWYKSSLLYVPEPNPIGPSTGQYRVVRGGAWNDIDYNLRSAYRFYNNPTYNYHNVGFRCISPVQ